MPSWITADRAFRQQMVSDSTDELRSRSSTLFQDEQRAPIAELSPTKRRALVICFEGDGMLHKCSGAWTSACAGVHQERIHGITVADFMRKYQRRAQKRVEPNDRRHGIDVEKAVKRMNPVELDRLLRDDESE